MRTTRRRFLKSAAASGAAVSLLGTPAIAQGVAGKVVVVGGGFGGATAAKYLKLANAKLDVTLIERDDRYITCPFSNYVLGGFRKIDENVQTFDALTKLGVKVTKGEAAGIDAPGRLLRLSSGNRIAYDKLIVSPGIELNYTGVPGYDEATSAKLPHAWKAGPQTTLLRSQLEAMPDGGTFIMVSPPNPFRCPPGPYERVSTIAWYFKNHKPKSKILILDAKDAFSKQGLFQAAWESEYPGMITWIAGKDGGKVESVDAASMTVKAGFGTEKGAVINVIPPQTAGRIAIDGGLADDRGWCAVDPQTFASRKAEHVYVIGDASIAGAMPKSGTAANIQGKVAAAAVVAALDGKTPGGPALLNICYSLVTPDYGISTTDVYQVTADRGIVAMPNAGGVSPRAPTAMNERKLEAEYTRAWYQAITTDTWG